MRIEAQMTLPDGRTPGKWRKGSAIILSCIAQGCRIYPNPLNKIPDEYRQYLVDADSNGGHPGPVVVPDTDHEPVVVPQLTTQRKRGRPKKAKA